MFSRKWFILLAALILPVLVADAQLVYVKCCTSVSNEQCIGPCLSGPGIRQKPSGCQSHANCIYGFGPDPKSFDLAYGMCAEDTFFPDQSNSWCNSWRELSIPVVELCAGKSPRGLSAYVIWDQDGDGDLDLRDFAKFQNFLGYADVNP